MGGSGGAGMRAKGGTDFGLRSLEPPLWFRAARREIPVQNASSRGSASPGAAPGWGGCKKRGGPIRNQPDPNPTLQPSTSLQLCRQSGGGRGGGGKVGPLLPSPPRHRVHPSPPTPPFQEPLFHSWPFFFCLFFPFSFTKTSLIFAFFFLLYIYIF